MTFATLRNLGDPDLASPRSLASHMSAARCAETMVTIDNFTFRPRSSR